jgi:hypothetical protein
LRVVAAVTEDEAAMYRDGAVLEMPENVLEAVLEAFEAVEAVIEGHLTPAALRTGEGAYPKMPRIERPSLFIPRAFRRRDPVGPQAEVREREERVARLEPEVLAALERGEPHAFVATDLLWLDGQALDDIPLLERKRLLEAVLGESRLVRVSAFVRASAMGTLVSWGTLGFEELSYRAPNSRYLAGEVNLDWAIAPAPDSPVRR